MTKFRILRLLAAMLFPVLASVPVRSADRPNLVLIVADDLGYGETGMQGNREIPTPAIDRLAADGVRCTAGYVTSSYCSPSRAGMMTGRFQSRFGYDLNPTGERNLLPNAGLPGSETTFVERMRQVGYRTGLVGKWHLGASPAMHPTQRGFDSFYGFLHEGHYFVPGPPYENVLTMTRTRSLAPGERVREGNWIRGNYTGGDEPDYDGSNPILRMTQSIEEPEYLTDAITREAVSFIAATDADQPQPFALVVAYNAVHSPMQGLTTDLEAIHGIEDDQRKIFAAMLVALDRGVGRIRQAIDSAGLTGNTLVVFLSDNGGPTRELTSSNAPLRGGKGDVYEGGVRVPMVWAWPGKLPAGRIEDRPVLSLDIAATALALAGVEDSQPMDGIDVTQQLTGQKAAPVNRRIYWRMQRGKTALREGDWKLVRPGPTAPLELYHLASDPGETRDLAATESAAMRSIVQAWMAMDAEMAPPIELGN